MLWWALNVRRRILYSITFITSCEKGRPRSRFYGGDVRHALIKDNSSYWLTLSPYSDSAGQGQPFKWAPSLDNAFLSYFRPSTKYLRFFHVFITWGYKAWGVANWLVSSGSINKYSWSSFVFLTVLVQPWSFSLKRCSLCPTFRHADSGPARWGFPIMLQPRVQH